MKAKWKKKIEWDLARFLRFIATAGIIVNTIVLDIPILLFSLAVLIAACFNIRWIKEDDK